MALISRRRVLAAGATLPAALAPRKPWAQEMRGLSEALRPTTPATEPPDIEFFTADGTPHRLTEFRGRGMVVNFWATWCGPCVTEMPSLESLSKALAPHDIAVLPLSSDRGGASTVRAWYRDHGISGLPVLLDPKGRAAQAWHARGLPTTVVIDSQGRDRARLEGAADWSAPDAVALIRRLTAG